MSEQDFGSYVCAHCGETFDRMRSPEEAMADAKQRWSPSEIAMPQVEICDDCFQRFMEWFKQHPEIRIQ